MLSLSLWTAYFPSKRAWDDNSKAIARLLHQEGADPSIAHRRNSSRFRSCGDLACATGDISMLLDYQCLNINNCADMSGLESLVYLAASHENCWPMLPTLLHTPGVSINGNDKASFTALNATFLLPILKLLLSHPCVDVNIEHKSNRMLAPLISTMLRTEERVDRVRLFLLHPDVDVNVQDASGRTPLMLAIDHGYHEVARLLAQHPRIDLTITDVDGRTALLRAGAGGLMFNQLS